LQSEAGDADRTPIYLYRSEHREVKKADAIDEPNLRAAQDRHPRRGDGVSYVRWALLICAGVAVFGGAVWIAYTGSVALHEGSWRRRIRR